MKKLFMVVSLVVMTAALTPLYSIAQDKEHGQRSVGPANFYISIKDKIGITKEQEDKLITIEKTSLKKLDDISQKIMKEQQSLGALTQEDDIDLKKSKEILNRALALEFDGKYLVIETLSLENKVLSKEQRGKAKGIALEMSKGMTPPAKK